MEPPGRDGSTVAQLKHDIDSGLTGTKTATADPGLSALGTDDEAAGRPTAPADVTRARRQEQAIGRIATAADVRPTKTPTLILIGAVVVLACVIVAALLLGR